MFPQALVTEDCTLLTAGLSTVAYLDIYMRHLLDSWEGEHYAHNFLLPPPPCMFTIAESIPDLI